MAFRDYDPGKPIISIHMPKCGGTSIAETLAGWYKEKFFGHYYDEQNGLMPTRHVLSPGICIHGHFNSARRFGVKDYYPMVDQFVTVLRNPVEIAISNYFHLKRHRNENYRDGRLFNFKNEFSNVNQFLLKHRLPLMGFLPFIATKDNYKALIDRHFIFVGVVEHMDITGRAFARKLGFPTGSIGRVNQSERDEEVDDAVMNEFIRRHSLEYAIYEYALNCCVNY